MALVNKKKEHTLDPEDWDGFRILAHRMVDDMVNHLSTIRTKPVWQPIPEDVRQRLKQELPLNPRPLEETYEEFVKNVLPYGIGNIHPRFWGWVVGTGTMGGIMAEMLAAAMNGPVSGFQQSSDLVESQVLDWFKTIVGYPSSASGILVSGGSTANFTALSVARNTKAKANFRMEGFYGSSSMMICYASDEVHNSVDKSIELLGFGNRCLRKISVDNKYRIDVRKLRETIQSDLESGFQPFCVIGSAGTVNTGAVDDLQELANLAEEFSLWFHVDGAIGGLAGIAPSVRPLLRGLERADSIAFDLHKWMHIPYQVGGVLFRNEEFHRRTFSKQAEYLSKFDRGIAAASMHFRDYGLELSRGFRALKIWMTFSEHGTRKLGAMIDQNIEQVQYLESMIQVNSELELLAPACLNIVCFRFVGDPRMPEEELNMLNQEVLLRLQESGVAAPSSTVLNGKFAIRVSNTNHRTLQEDFDVLVLEVVKLGRKVARGSVGILSARS